MLTAKQHQTYEFICQYIKQNGYAPTEAEIAEGIGIKSRGVVHRYVTALADAEMIALLPNRRRNICVLADLDDEAGEFELPVLGRIAAGQPIEAVEDKRSLNIADSFLGPDRFVLQVKGDSMIGDNICNGDYIICEKRSTASQYEIAVVLVDGQEATLKRVRKNNNNTVSLIPSNASLSAIVYDAARVMIQGIYLGLLRINQ